MICRSLSLCGRALLLGFVLLMRSSSYLENGVAPNAAMRLTFAAVPLDSSVPNRKRVGELEYQGGWMVHSDVPQFGGISSLYVEENHFTALSDTGALASWALNKSGQPVEARIKPLLKGCLNGLLKESRDSESMAHDPVSGKFWVGLESVSRICRYDAGFKTFEAMRIPAQMKNWPSNGGAESLVRLPDGRFISIAEDVPDGARARPILIFDRDPTDPRVRVTQMVYDAPDDYSVSDMAQLPDGRLLVLNRDFTPPEHGFSVIVSIIDPFVVKTGEHVKSHVIARFAPPLVTDNYEALAITVEHSTPMLWIMSDDNYMDFQRTYLLKFAFRG